MRIAYSSCLWCRGVRSWNVAETRHSSRRSWDTAGTWSGTGSHPRHGSGPGGSSCPAKFNPSLLGCGVGQLLWFDQCCGSVTVWYGSESRGSVPLTKDPDSDPDPTQDPTTCYFLKLHWYYFSKKKKSQNSRNKGFLTIACWQKDASPSSNLGSAPREVSVTELTTNEEKE